MRLLTILLCLIHVYLPAQSAEAPSAQIQCQGLATVGVPIDPGYDMENHGLSEFQISISESDYNKCKGQSTCWMTGKTEMSFRSAPNVRVILNVSGGQEKPGDAVMLGGIEAKLISGDKILAVSSSSKDSVSLINPEPYQILRDLGKPNLSIYDGYNYGFLKGNLLSEIEISCSVVK